MKFKVGDRVAVYDFMYIGFGGYGRQIGIIEEIDEEGAIHVNVNGVVDCFHPKQCRRLVKKKKGDILLTVTGLDSTIEKNKYKYLHVTRETPEEFKNTPIVDFMFELKDRVDQLEKKLEKFDKFIKLII